MSPPAANFVSCAGKLQAKQAQRHDTSPQSLPPRNQKRVHFPFLHHTSHTLPEHSDSYHTTTLHLHLPLPPTKPAFRPLRTALTENTLPTSQPRTQSVDRRPLSSQDDALLLSGKFPLPSDLTSSPLSSNTILQPPNTSSTSLARLQGSHHEFDLRTGPQRMTCEAPGTTC
jgi:hypothetical protein